jgi:membrane protease YdiL (CAAX protease family)
MPGKPGVWIIALLLLAYSVAILSYALTGKFDPGLFSSELSVPVILFILLAALMEEVVFRGLVLQALVRAWGSAQIGIIKSALVSSLFFCSIHLFDLLGGRPLSAVFLQSLEAFFLGIVLGALVLSGKSIYPAVLLHGILNLSAYLLIENTGGVEPASSSWLLMSLFMLPLALYGLYLLRDLSLQFAQSNSSMSNEYSGR